MKIKDEKMYLVMNQNIPGSIFVLDLTTKELLYKGTLEIKDPEAEQKKYYLSVYDMDL